MANVGWATLSVIPSTKGFQGALEKGTNPALAAAGRSGGTRFGDAAGRSAGQRFGSVFKTAAKAGALGALAAAAGAIKLGSDSIQLASDQQESINAVDVAYGKQARAVQRLGRQSAKSLALPRAEFNQLAVRFSNFANVVAGGDGKKTVKTLDDLTKRGADFASVYNLEAAEALTLFQSGLAGETEPLRRFGIDMSAARVEAFAYANGLAEAGSKLTESEKVQARYQILMQDTAKTQGDLANTSDSLANRQRFLSARWDEARATLGTALLPIVERFVGFLLDEGIPAFEKASDWFTSEGIPKIEALGDKLKPLAEELLPAAADGFKSIRNFAEDALPFAEGIVAAFNDMPGWVKKTLILGAAGGLTAKKLGLGKLGGDFLSKGGSPARPLYVFVVNQGGKPGVVPGGVPKPGALPKWAPFIPVGLNSAPGQDSLMRNLFGFGMEGSADDRFNPQDVKSATEFQKLLTGEVDKTRVTWLHTKEAVEDYSRFVQQRVPREIHTTVTGWDVAKQDVREYLELLLQTRGAHIDTRLDAAGGTPRTRGGITGARGRAVTVNNTFNVNTTKDAEAYYNHRTRQIGAGGFG